MSTSWWDSISGISGRSGLGQRVVDVLASTVSQHVNLMDAEGVIVASTDPARIGSQHRAALDVLQGGQPVVVERSTSGVSDRPGVNLPLVIDGQLSGVVGITGDPAELESVAKVVALTVELLIEQERAHLASLDLRGRARELVSALVSAARPLAQARELAGAAGLGEGPWSVGVWADAEIPMHGASAPPEAAERIAAQVNQGHGRPARDAGDPGAAVAVVWRGLLWVVSAGGLSEELGGRQTRHLVINNIPDLDMLRSWAQDMAALGERARLLPGGGPEDPPAELAVAAARLPEPTLRRMAGEIERLSGGQRDTVRVLSSVGSMTEASRRLYLHRNTLLQRVVRIRELTNLDLRNPQEAAVLKMSLLAWDCTRPEGA